MITQIAPGGGLSQGEQISCLILPALPMAPGWARRQVRAALSAWYVPPDVVQSAVLVVSELATNSINFIANRSDGQELAGAQRISVALRLLPGRVVIEVTDNDPRPPVLSDAGPEAENGRGLILVQAVAKEWGYYAPPSGGKVTFAVLSTPETETAGHLADGRLPGAWAAS